MWSEVADPMIHFAKNLTWFNKIVKQKGFKVQFIFSYESLHFKALKVVQLTFSLVNMNNRNVLLDLQIPLIPWH